MAALLSCIPLFSGCAAKIDYVLKDDGGEKYYAVTGSGYVAGISGELVIPETYGEGELQAPVKEIAQEAFRGATITSLTIPASVTKIGMAAFANCESLSTVTFADGITVEELPQAIFGFCGNLQQFNIPQTVKVIGEKAFYNCAKITEVQLPSAVEKVMHGAFQGCNALEKVTLNEGLEFIGESAFYYSGVREITLPSTIKDTTVVDENGVAKTSYGISMGAFHSCENLEKVVIKSQIATIRAGVFGYCPSLKTVYLPATIKKIEGAFYADNKFYSGHAFHHNGALTDVYFAGTAEQWLEVSVDNTPASYEGTSYNNDAIKNATKHFNAEF